MFFTSREKQAIVKASNMMIHADGKIDWREIFLKSTFLAMLNISETDIEDSEKLTIEEAIIIISKMNMQCKRIVYAILGYIMVADDHIDDAEVNTLSVIAELCKLPYITKREAAEELKNLACLSKN